MLCHRIFVFSVLLIETGAGLSKIYHLATNIIVKPLTCPGILLVRINQCALKVPITALSRVILPSSTGLGCNIVITLKNPG